MSNEVSKLHADAIDLAALAGMLAEELINGRSIHPDDAGKPSVAAVADLLARNLAAHRDALEAASG